MILFDGTQSCRLSPGALRLLNGSGDANHELAWPLERLRERLVDSRRPDSRDLDGESISVVGGRTGRLKAIARHDEASVYRINLPHSHADDDVLPTWEARVGQGMVRVSQAWSSLCGLTTADALRDGWLRALVPDDREPARHALETALGMERPMSFEARLDSSGDDGRWVLISGQPLLSPKGLFLGLRGVFVEKPPGWKRDQHLRSLGRSVEAAATGAAEPGDGVPMGLGGERFTGVVASLPEPVAALDNDLRFIAFNEAYARSFMDVTGESPTLGMTLAEALRKHPEYLPAALDLWKRALSGEAFTVLRPSRVPDGNPHTYELGFNPIWGQGGQVVGAVNIVRDVTEQARIQEVQRKMIAELEDRITLRTEEFNGLIQNSPVAFCLFDRELRYLRINRTLAAMKGGSMTDFIGSRLGDFRPEYREGLGAIVRSVFETGHSVENMEVVLPGPELAEGERHLLVMAYPVRGAGGAVSQVGVLAMDITARKVAQRRLQRSEERYRNLLQAGRDALLIYPIDENDRPGKFIEVNDAACARYGYTRAEMLRMDVTQIIARDIDVAAKIRSLVEAGQRIIQSVHRTASGELIPMEVSASVHEMDGGRFVMSNCRDISERVEAERALRESESRFRNLADSMPQIVWSAGVDGSVNYANRQWYEYSGLSSDIPLERAAWRAMHPADRKAAARLWRDRLRDGRMLQLEMRLRHAASGEYRWQLTRAVPISGADGRLARWFGTTTDIHDHKLASHALEQSETRLTLALEVANAGTWDWDVANDVLYWSEGVYRLVGMEPGSVRPSFDLWVGTIHPDDRAMVLSRADSRQHRADELHFEYRTILPGGSAKWLELRGHIFRDEDGRPLRQVGVLIDIDARKRLEGTLRDSEERFRSMFENAAVGMALLGVRGEFQQVNETFARILNYSVEELVGGMTFTDVTHPEDMAVDVAERTRMISGEIRSFRREKRYFRKDGGIIWVRLTLSARRDMSGQVEQFIAIIQDITERKQTEAERDRLFNELSAANSLLDNLIDNAPVGIGFWDTDLRFVRLNEALAEMNGLTREEHIGKTVAEILPELPVDIMMAFRHVRETGDIIRHSVTGETPAAPGITRFWDVIYYPVQVDGETMGIGAICEEVTERRRAQEAILRANERIRSILESIGDGFISLDREFRFSYLNHTASTLLRRDPHELQGSCFWEVFPQTRGTIFEERFARSMRNSQNDHFEGVFEPWGQWFDVRIYATHDGLSVFFADVTERKKAEDALRQAKEAAEAANRAKSAFLASMSHDIRTPLTSILGFAELLAERVGPEEREHAESIRRGGERLMETLNSVLALARLEGRRVDLKPTLVNAGVELVSLRQMFLRQAEEKNLQIRLNLPSKDIWIEVDRSGLSRALMNLIGNAIKFTRRGNVTLSLLRNGPEALIRVSDTGQGISSTFLPRIFEPFVRGADGGEGSPEGSGLGLAITRQIVELMGGRIEVASEVGRGTSFTMHFPVARQQEEQASPPGPQVPAQATERLKMLVVEDYQNIRTILKVMLEDSYELRMEGTVNAALDAAGEFKADIVLLDINIEEKDSGVRLYHRLRAMDHYATKPIVAFTAYAMPEDQERFAEIGFNACLVKPFTRQSLETALREALEA